MANKNIKALYRAMAKLAKRRKMEGSFDLTEREIKILLKEGFTIIYPNREVADKASIKRVRVSWIDPTLPGDKELINKAMVLNQIASAKKGRSKKARKVLELIKTNYSSTTSELF